MFHLPNGSPNQHSNLQQAPPHCPCISALTCVPKVCLDFTHIALFALNVGDLAVKFADFGRKSCHMSLVGPDEWQRQDRKARKEEGAHALSNREDPTFKSKYILMCSFESQPPVILECRQMLWSPTSFIPFQWLDQWSSTRKNGERHAGRTGFVRSKGESSIWGTSSVNDYVRSCQFLHCT